MLEIVVSLTIVIYDRGTFTVLATGVNVINPFSLSLAVGVI
jgi:hypothetical protein